MNSGRLREIRVGWLKLFVSFLCFLIHAASENDDSISIIELAVKLMKFQPVFSSAAQSNPLLSRRHHLWKCAVGDYQSYLATDYFPLQSTALPVVQTKLLGESIGGDRLEDLVASLTSLYIDLSSWIAGTVGLNSCPFLRFRLRAGPSLWRTRSRFRLGPGRRSRWPCFCLNGLNLQG